MVTWSFLPFAAKIILNFCNIILVYILGKSEKKNKNLTFNGCVVMQLLNQTKFTLSVTILCKPLLYVLRNLLHVFC